MIFALFMVLVTASPIKHVIVLMAENRSFDHFFGWAADLLGGIIFWTHNNKKTQIRKKMGGKVVGPRSPALKGG